MAEILENQVLHTLGQVIDEQSERNIVSLGIVKDITVSEGKVSCILEFQNNDQKKNSRIFEDSKKAIEEIPGVTKVDIITTFHQEHAKDEDEKFEAIKTPINNQLGTSKIKYILAVASGKGGVGKSTIASNIAIGLNKLGAKVGLIDADIFGPSIPLMFNCENEQPNFKKEGEKNIIIPIEQYGIKLLSMGVLIPKEKAVIWRGPMASSALKQMILDVEWGKLDYLIVDLPPGTSDIHITLSQNFLVSGSIIITTPQKVSTIDAEKAVAMFNQKNTKVPILGLIQNMSHFIDENGSKHYIFGKDGGKKLSKRLSIEILGDIPLERNISESSDNGYPIILKDDYCSKIFYNICENIEKRINKKNSK